MANTQHNAPQPDSNVSHVHAASSEDRKAWCDAATTRKYRVHENMPYSYGSEMIFPLPAPVGFASLHPGVRPLVFQAVAQFVTNRIGQTQDGNVAAKIAACLGTGDGMPSAQTNDAFDAAYRDHIAGIVEGKLGNYATHLALTDADGKYTGELKAYDKPLTGEELKVAKAKRDGIIEASANSENNKAKYFEASVKAAVERGTDKPTSGKAKRVAKATTGGLDL